MGSSLKVGLVKPRVDVFNVRITDMEKTCADAQSFVNALKDEPEEMKKKLVEAEASRV